MNKVDCTNYIEAEGTYYILDMNALSKYIVGVDDDKIIEKTKSERWMASETPGVKELDLVAKDITETSSSRKDENAPFRAEIAKMMLTLVLYPIVGEDGDSQQFMSLDEPKSIGQVIAFNTLLSEGIIKEIQIEDEEE